LFVAAADLEARRPTSAVTARVVANARAFL